MIGVLGPTGQIGAPLMAALRTGYRPVYDDSLPPALHVVVWLPK